MRFDVKAGLQSVKDELKAKVDYEAWQLRSQYITTIPGQDMVYMEKRLEAEIVVADPDLGENLSAAEIPHVAKEATTSGVSRFDKSVEILTLANLWKQVSPAIEDRRLSTKSAIDAAITVAEARALSVVDWSDLSLM
ncbi:tail assembly chaperone [Rhizobium phage vB_RleS_L338C]|uniref:tail assembly chaperone n=1 Tax=Rhizobium phage vB_RleS_L338C TaxID=1414737 RepID=UPI0003D87A82|nr:tail assembly chaperone [Rhizobium phage vB_RleS_L338C]AHC30460.1 tail assembly chaperone [Rhizobium phage vB_RleS_L338C]QNH72116.1 tail assembly chaperone [Rhizobium phage P11VFA]